MTAAASSVASIFIENNLWFVQSEWGEKEFKLSIFNGEVAYQGFGNQSYNTLKAFSRKNKYIKTYFFFFYFFFFFYPF